MRALSCEMSKPSREFVEYLRKEAGRFPKRLELKLTNVTPINDFTLKRTIGLGSFGRVFFAVHNKSKRVYAAKVMEKAKIVQMEQVKRVIEERKILQSVANQFMVNLRFSHKTNSYLYLMMPFIRGGELFTRLQDATKLPQNEVKFYAAQVVLAFEYLHTLNVLYRDLKPENVLLDCDGYIKLVDFGFAKRVLNKTSSFVGTPEYMAPEMLIKTKREKGYSFSIDWWAFGVFIYELSSGNPPFSGDNLFQVFNHIVKKEYGFPSEFDESLINLLDNIFQVDVEFRIGCRKNGISELKEHPWFGKINWWALYHKQIKANFIPDCSHPQEDSNYAKYEEESMEENDKEAFKDLFEDF